MSLRQRPVSLRQGLPCLCAGAFDADAAKSRTLHCHPLHFAYPAVARSDFGRLAPTRYEPPSVHLHGPVGGYWRGTCEVFVGGNCALIVRCRPSRSIVARAKL